MPGGWHNYIIYSRIAADGEYKAVTKGREPQGIDDVRKQVQDMRGTDILTYEL